ncbi:MAG: hypothetical protein F6K56_02340 [Moorea sp. SIO3G5]|nr:hypothetical protein [Moorena sp. SIO3G5]
MGYSQFYSPYSLLPTPYSLIYNRSNLCVVNFPSISLIKLEAKLNG